MSIRPSPYKRHIFPQLRPLAPKVKASSFHQVSPAQHRRQLQHHNIRKKQDTAASPATTANVKLKQRETSQSYFPSVSSSHGHDFTPSPLLPPDPTDSSLERKQYAVVTPCTKIYSNSVPSTSADDSIAELAPGNLLSGALMVASESHGLSNQHPPYDNLQLQETVQNQQGQDYWTPTLDSLMQSTVDAHQNQSPQLNSDQYPTVPTQQSLPVQPAYYTPLQQNSQHVACVNCPSVWRSHLESITLSNLEDKGMSDLRRSYRHLKQHIREAHQGYDGVSCALCENLFCYHLETMMLLEVVEGNFPYIKLDLGSSFMMLRKHIQEAHGGC